MSAFGGVWGRSWGGPESSSIQIIPNTIYVPITSIDGVLNLTPKLSLDLSNSSNQAPYTFIKGPLRPTPIIRKKDK